jgi:hypothetical protein
VKFQIVMAYQTHAPLPNGAKICPTTIYVNVVDVMMDHVIVAKSRNA